MPVVATDTVEALPPSHLYLSVTHRRTIRTVRLSMMAVRLGFAGAAALVVWLVGSSLFLLFHDGLVSRLMARQAATQYAYEARIADLRGQVEHQSSLKLVGETTLDGRLKELAGRAAVLEVRAGLLDALHARPASDLPPGLGASIVPGKPSPSAKPQVEGRAAASTNVRLAGVEEAIEHVDAAQLRRLDGIRAGARRRADALRSAVLSSGLSVERVTSRPAELAEGGPFVPLDPAVTGSVFGRGLEAARLDVATADALGRALPRLPFGRPLAGNLEVTSSFGARLDPFLGRPAMHTGVDFREENGSDVRATAAGRVTAAGPTGGYGVMVEVDHGHGLATRYAHLSAVAVEVGQIVGKGAVVGEVGSTGRATGPHLHYETRIDGEPVDPERFLQAGERLASLPSTY